MRFRVERGKTIVKIDGERYDNEIRGRVVGLTFSSPITEFEEHVVVKLGSPIKIERRGDSWYIGDWEVTVSHGGQKDMPCE